MYHRVVCWENVEEEVSEKRDFLWQTTSVDQNQDLKRRNMAVRLYAKSMVRSSTPKLARRVAILSRRNAGHSSTPKLVKKVASLPNVSKVQNSIPKLAKKAASAAVLPLIKRNVPC